MTERGRETLLFILECICTKQRPPTWREMEHHFGIAPNGVTGRINRLARDGWLRRHPGRAAGCAALRVLGCSYRYHGGRLYVVCDATPEGVRLHRLIAGRTLPKEAPCPA